MDRSDLEFWAFVAFGVPALLVPMAIAWWKGSSIGVVALLSLVFWPGALVLALRLPRRPDQSGAQQRRN